MLSCLPRNSLITQVRLRLDVERLQLPEQNDSMKTRMAGRANASRPEGRGSPLEPMIDLSEKNADVTWMSSPRMPYPSEETDTEWYFLLPYLLLIREDVPPRADNLLQVFNGLRYVVKTRYQ